MSNAPKNWNDYYTLMTNQFNKMVDMYGQIQAVLITLGTLHTDLSTLNTTITNDDASLLAVYNSSAAAITVSPVVTTASVKIVNANPNRKGLIIYNNSANSGYIAFGAAANSSTSMTAIIATFTSYSMAFPIYKGAIYAVRNAGTGTFLITELT